MARDLARRSGSAFSETFKFYVLLLNSLIEQEVPIVYIGNNGFLPTIHTENYVFDYYTLLCQKCGVSCAIGKERYKLSSPEGVTPCSDHLQMYGWFGFLSELKKSA